jgi:hypothetical protein
MSILDRWKRGDPSIIRAPKPTIFLVTEDNRIVNERLEDRLSYESARYFGLPALERPR